MELRELVLQRIQDFNENIDKCLKEAAFYRDDDNESLRSARVQCAENYRIRVSELEWLLSKV